jgi:uncharacterized protein
VKISVLDYQQVASGKVRHLVRGSGANLVACGRSPLRLGPGADLKGELLALAARERVRAGWVLTCAGSLSRVSLRLAGGAEHGTWQGSFEIVALTGTLSSDGGHLHLAVADHQGRTLGGHLADGCTVRTTAEVVLGVDDRLVFAREHDPATGYDELVVRERDP